MHPNCFTQLHSTSTEVVPWWMVDKSWMQKPWQKAVYSIYCSNWENRPTDSLPGTVKFVCVPQHPFSQFYLFSWKLINFPWPQSCLLLNCYPWWNQAVETTADSLPLSVKTLLLRFSGLTLVVTPLRTPFKQPWLLQTFTVITSIKLSQPATTLLSYRNMKKQI